MKLALKLVGLLLAYMGGAQLGRIGAQSFIADVVTVKPGPASVVADGNELKVVTVLSLKRVKL